MTTNIDRAARAVWEASRGVGEPLSGIASYHIAAALADATPPLLMPDLPEPAEEEALIYFGDDPNTYAFPDGRVMTIHGDSWCYATAEELRARAYTLLAAANYAEKKPGVTTNDS